MRIHILAALAFVMPACAGDITSPGGGGDDTGAVCGNGATEAGETCDDGNAVAGDGCSATCQMEQTAAPHVAGTVDRQTVTTELYKTETLVYTITGSNGFAGDVTVTPSVVDDQGNAVSGWTLTPTQPSVTLTENGSAQVSVSVMIPSDNEALTPTVKLSLASTAAASDVTSAFTIANQVTFNIEAGTGTARPHAGTLPLPNSRLTIHNGTKVIFHNADGTSHRIHADGGITHEPDELTTGNDYVATPTSNASWYCHDHENPMAGDTRIIEVIP